MPCLIEVDGEHFALDTEPEVVDCRTRILTAVRSGGDFVLLRRRSGAHVEVLVTANTRVRLEHITRTDPAEPNGEQDPDFSSSLDWL